MAKPTPSLAPDWLSIWLFTPMTRPCMFSNGPPELPGLTAASVWIAPAIEYELSELIVRLSALTIPLVTVSARPKGLPIATTPSPTCTFDESARVRGCSLPEGASIFRTARSLEASWPTTVALYFEPS